MTRPDRNGDQNELKKGAGERHPFLFRRVRGREHEQKRIAGAYFPDVIPKGSSKQVGVDKMLDYFGISLDESMAFGDGGNDVLMLKHVGIGVAMGNAEDEVKRAADYVTDSVDEDGVEKALRHFGVI